MKKLTAVLVLLLTTGAASADLDGSYLLQVLPNHPINGSGVTCLFVVKKDTLSDERILDIDLLFPPELAPLEETMGHDPIEPGRPEFDMSVFGRVAQWNERHPETGGIHRGEGVAIRIDAFSPSGVPQGAVLSVYWELRGSWGSSLMGEIGLPTPVEPASWGVIKALFKQRQQPN